ncbi:purine-cytosine permease family protein [Tsukamurella paurometabola]|uniref:Permease for cytosine/purines uracil thiamine allantoin n=1 Tax=Tsukamurella paurometabola (strain ATCC 8368 / DSM 20162 / CCUG 35730 / CIP 100753 / JCM 10117 / KCTC 9821 / NBRC 16120 / NCIMB 702349 / NCTC 13040) TaxID=521096 RepID=D5UM83_TSUPD|nr:cytosine permease [Tsukamurella paurometabola]ADG78363.1 permease for cytosine/purines uracil thiamine allantoin [Tsukamurella paurometabola DSM 20162]SUP31355.1 Permease for cytosine/purines, uracil, thiamine, allantoin [Tsukamurella paurometabola]
MADATQDGLSGHLTTPEFATGPETRGIELVPDTERGGSPRSLVCVWATPSVSFLSISVGATLVAGLGLSLLQVLVTAIIASSGWVLVGLIAVSGPVSGTSSSVITRAVYGVRGNKLVVGLYGWLLAAVYISLSWSAASLNGMGLLGRFGAHGSTLSTLAVIVVIVAVTSVLAVYGHGLIVASYPYVIGGVTVVLAVSAAFMDPYADLSYRPAEPLSGLALAGAMTIGATILVSTPLSFINSPDLARYLPADTAPWRTGTATALGGAIPGIATTMVGALLATAPQFDMVGDPMGAFSVGLPTWLFAVFTLAVIASAVALNAMTMYSAGLSLQALGIPIRRIPSTVIIAAIGAALTGVSIVARDFTTAVSALLQLVVIAAGPLIAVFATDVLLRRNRYNGAALLDDSPGSPFWFRRGFRGAGVISLIAGGAASSLCVNTTVVVGPVAALTGLDLSVPAGLLVASGCYALLYRADGTAGAAAVPIPHPRRQDER